MKALVAIALAIFSVNAQADGFLCETVRGDLKVKVFNNTDAEEGTRVASTLIISDTTVSAGRKTIARFTDANGTLESEGARYVADVDLRFNDSGRAGELISGTKLGELDRIIVGVDFSYAAPVEAGEELSGHLVLVKRNGDRIRRALVCSRYLKN